MSVAYTVFNETGFVAYTVTRDQPGCFNRGHP
jgi:hypothetical protein